MRYFSTFTGIGGFELGIIKAHEKLRTQNEGQGLQGVGSEEGQSRERPDLSAVGLTCVGYSEIDKYAVQIYQSHFPEQRCEIHNRPTGENEETTSTNSDSANITSQHTRQSTNGCGCRHINYGDITRIVAEELPDFDLLVGGFPCQAFSIAGKRKGFGDTRGTLFFDLARILRAKQPRLFVFENVKGLLSHDNGNTFRTIIATLDELGYDCQWQVLNSKNHGVPQNRERVLIVGHLRGTPRPEVFPFREANQGTHGGEPELSREIQTERESSNCRHSDSSISQDGENGHLCQLNSPKHSNDRVYGADGISPTLNTMQGGLRQPFIKVPEATKKGYAEAHVGQSINLSVMGSATRRGRVSDVAQTIDTGMQQHTLTEDMRIRRLTPVECERLQGFPDGWTEGVSDTQRYKTLGNAVTTNVIRDIMQKLI